jgi:uncharacterized protein
MKPLTSALLLTAAVQCAALITVAQDAKPRDHGYEMLKKGVELEGSEDYAGAAEVYATVNRNDSVYERVLLRHISTLIELEKHADAIPLCDRGMEIGGEHAHRFLINKGVCLSGMKEYDKAIAVFDQGVTRYPGNFNMRNLRALVFEEKGDVKTALAAMKDNAKHFPMHQEAHMSLAGAAFHEGKTSQAALAYFMAMIVTWGDKRSEVALGLADGLLNGNLDHESKGYDLAMGDDFAELDLLLANRVAMNKSYKMKPDLPYPIVRQGHFLLNSLKDMPTGDGFWSTYYVPVFKKMVAQGQFEAFAYHCLGNSSEPKVNTHAVKHKGDVEEFRRTLSALLGDAYATYEDSCGGTVKPVFHIWNDDQNLLGMGEGNINKNEHFGPWVFYLDNGSVSARGSFNNEHNKDGEWTSYYNNGVKARTNVWVNDEETGLFRSWHRNGVPKDSVAVVKGVGEGAYTEHWDTGRIRSRKTFTNSELTGPASYYYANNALEFRTELVKDENTGPVTAYHPDGKVKFTGAFKAGKRDGVVETLYLNGVKESSYTYAEGERNGPFTEWYANGQKQSEGTYTDGNITGKRTVWNANGTVASEEEYDANGREQGVHKGYTMEGVLYTELEYNRGMLIRYRYFDRSGKMLSEAKRSSGKFNFVGYTPGGSKMMEGSYLDEGAKTGPWKWYWPDGTLQSEESQKMGKVDGTQRSYFENGKLKIEYRYLPGKGRTGPYSDFRMDGTVDDQGYVQDGNLNGELRRALPNGKVYSHEYYVDGDRTGWQSFYDMDGVLEAEERVEDGFVREVVNFGTDGKEYQRIVIGHGKFVYDSKYPDGKKKSRVEYTNMVRNGLATWYFPDGTKEQEGNYLNGEEHGVWKGWHPNGKLRYERTFDNGAIIGTDKFYYVDGTPDHEETYKDGWSVGSKEYHPNGKLAIEREKRLGQLHGAARSYSMNGDLQLVRYYLNDRMIGYSYNGPDGKLVDTIPLGEGVLQLRPKYANGTPSREMDYRNDDIEGTYREFYTDGKVMEEVVFEGGQMHGVDKEFWPTGKPAAITPWHYDLRHGEQLVYWDNGQLQDKCHWVYGDRHGERVLYDRTGKPTLILTYRDDTVIAMRKP